MRRLAARRPVLAGSVVAALAVSAFAWWTISPLFLSTTLTEALPSPTQSPGSTMQPTGSAAARVIAAGSLQRVDDLHQGTGPVKLVEIAGKTYLRFENVTIQNGPDLHVYLARGTGGTYDSKRDLYLGALKASRGSFNYELPGGTRTSDFRSVVVWCRAFAVLFTWADLRAES